MRFSRIVTFALLVDSLVIALLSVSAVAERWSLSENSAIGRSAVVTQQAVRGEEQTVINAPLPPLPGCAISPRSAVVDKAAQRWWLCRNGQAFTDRLPMTSASAAYGLPPVGTHYVFARDLVAFGTAGERLDRFVAFYVTPRGNRIAFHQFVNQSPQTVGDLDQRGQSAGCIRVLPSGSRLVWDFLQIGDPVVVITS